MAEMTKTVEELGAERLQRIQDAYDMKQPDRVPISLNLGYMLARLGGVTNQDIDEDPDLALELLKKWALYYQPDEISSGAMLTPGPSVIAGDRTTNWPGHGLPPDQPFQFVEREYMKADEYDEFLEDPTNYALRTYAPRAFEAFEGLAKLPRLTLLVTGYPGLDRLTPFALPEVISAFETMTKVAEENIRKGQIAMHHMDEMAKIGYPTSRTFAAICVAPFDFMGDSMRGTRGIMRDMYKQPEKLKVAMERSIDIQMDDVLTTAAMTGGTSVMIPLHKGSDGFMSLAQFEEFYWPTLLELMHRLIDHNLIPVPFYEGVWDDRLDYLAALPKGKTRGMFERSDMGKVKEAVGDVMCIQGGFPVSLLQGGTPEQVREHTKWMCEVVGEGGGFVMGASTAMDYCDPDLVKVWVDATKEYGMY